ncbi:MAG: hypothetical protein HKO56_02750 [Bacteroidia bacterium]|nr:hypothetical protein [Bacteroidia bacterium]NNM15552.1 hypothetical protein [Bacteroidia bacterium]
MRIIFYICFLLSLTQIANAQTVGLVFSGGGARGLAHVGALKALEEHDIPIDYITGSSMGSLIGSMYSMGMSTFEIEQIVTDESFHNWATGEVDNDLQYFFNRWEDDASWITINVTYDTIIKTRIPKSIVNPGPIDFAMMNFMSSPIAKAGYDFDSLYIPFRAVASDIITKQAVTFDSGDLALAVRASMAFPFLYSPVYIDDMVLFDGGIYNNFPADVMQQEFEPDLIIGINTGTREEEPLDNDLLSQVRSMLVQSTCYCVPGLNDIIIEPKVKQFEVFNFRNAQAIIDSGYNATIANIETIKNLVERRKDYSELENERLEFIKDQVPILIDKVVVDGLNENQKKYVVRSIKPNNNPISLGAFKKGYFKLNADENIRDLNTQLIFNDSTKHYDAYMLIKRENDLKVSFGGNFSSRPISQAFVGARYNILGKNSVQLNANSYIGKLYTSGLFSARVTVPGKVPVQIEPSFIINKWDYFKSSTTIFDDIKPSFLVQNDLSAKLKLALPASNKSKLQVESGYFKLKDEYYQTRNFSQSDTADITEFDGITNAISFSRNTLNRKQYATAGTDLSVGFRHVYGSENTIPGSTSAIKDTTDEDLDWLALRISYDNYFTHLGPVAIGINTNLLISDQPFFSTFTASILNAPAYHPINQSKTLFINEFRAHNFVGGGLRTVLTVKKNLDFRLEGFIFQPFEEIVRSSSGNKPEYSESFEHQFYIGSFNTVYNSPLGPISLSVNYYDQKDDPFEFLFHFGYLLYNQSALH